MQKPALILQSDRALTEIAVLRDAITGEAQNITETSWRGINTILQAV